MDTRPGALGVWIFAGYDDPLTLRLQFGKLVPWWWFSREYDRRFIVPGWGFTPMVLHTLAGEACSGRSGSGSSHTSTRGLRCSMFLQFLASFGEWMIGFMEGIQAKAQLFPLDHTQFSEKFAEDIERMCATNRRTYV